MNQMEYTVRESPRAKHVRLKVSLYDASLTIVIPKGFDRRRIPEVLQEKRSWIDRARKRVVEQREQADTELSGALPERIHLRAVEEEWRVEYKPKPDPALIAAEKDNHMLLLWGNTDDVRACRQLLQRWVESTARTHLTRWLASLSERHRLPMGRMLVKAQRTRWASCSTRKTISINRKLLFLPTPLVEYVLVHELCHTVHANHSQDFWALVRDRAPQYERVDVELRTAWRYVPAWMNTDLSAS